MARASRQTEPGSIAKFDAVEQRLVDWLGSNGNAMLALLHSVVNIDSGSGDKEGVNAVADGFRRFLEQRGIATSTSAGGAWGDIVRAALPPRANDNRPSILMMGHCDTVFGPGEAGRRPFTVKDGRAYGPGVADMKAGLVMNAFVIAAFKELDCLQSPLVALFTSDEEVGSTHSRATIENEARKAAYVLNSEPGRTSGNIVNQRKGGAFLRLKVTGKSAHSGVDFASGVSAIEELAHKIMAIHALTDLDRGITLNVGLISGGQSINTTAPYAEGGIDLRYRTVEDRKYAMDGIRRIVERNRTPGASATIETSGEFLPLTPTPASARMLHVYQEAARDLGFTVAAESTGGCADSGFAASVGAVTLCGLGPVGGKAHTSDEYVEINTIVPRAQGAALTILRLDRDLTNSAPQFTSGSTSA
jgi:glutamate carboxypeptidase